MTKTPRRTLDTRLVRAGSDPKKFDGAVNPPPQRASTVLMPTAEELYAPGVKTYGLVGMAAHDALKSALCEMEGARDCLLTASGLIACTLPIFALAGAGGHILVTDSVYGPTRRYCDRSLKRWGCETEYFDPDIGAGIEALIRPETQLIFLESPGSLTFEIQDTPAITEIARKHGVPTALDNTWGAGVYYKPLDLGVDVSIHATTKYPAGHSDVLSGAILTRDPLIGARIAQASTDLGMMVSAEDAYLTLRGLRTMMTRLRQHEASAYDVADWLAARPEVDRILHPGRPDDPY
ncbi:MAG: PLP-dependent transferase, partial [Pseudomonadota bacterium]